MKSHPSLISRFELFYDSTSDDLYKYIFFKTSRSTSADDIMQESYLRIFQRFDNYESESHRIKSLYTIARNLIADHFRSSAKSVSLEEYHMISIDTSPDITEILDVQIATNQLAKLINQLSQKEQEIIIKHSILEKPYRELSEQLQKPEPTIRKIHSRALQKLTLLFKEHYGINFKPY